MLAVRALGVHPLANRPDQPRRSNGSKPPSTTAKDDTGLAHSSGLERGIT